MEGKREYPLKGRPGFPFSLARRSREKGSRSGLGLHWHPEMEILYMRRGTVEVRSGKKDFLLQPGQIVFIPPEEVHAVYGTQEDGVYDVFLFSLDLLTMPEGHVFQRKVVQPLCTGQLRPPCWLSPRDDGYSDASEALERICNRSGESEEEQLTIFSQLVLLFSRLRPQMEKTCDEAVNKSNESVKNCLSYINANYFRRLTLQEIARQVHLHPNYLCSLFREYTGQSVFQYLIRVRVEHAARLLGAGDISVGAAAAACVFDNADFFTRKFRGIMGINPKQYSIRCREQGRPDEAKEYYNEKTVVT